MKKRMPLLEEVVTVLECTKIDSGTFDVYNPDHLALFVEHMVELGMTEEDAESYLSKSMDEGKYPERQAYNKDGWLVTFPSKEYRDKAIKKGTHSVSDPTHGKGGMNLYYKRKGKQKRQTQQAATSTQAAQQQVLKNKAGAPVAQKGTTSPKTVKQPPSQPSQPQQAPEEDDYDFQSRDDELEKYIAGKSGQSFKSKYSQPTTAGQSSEETPKPAQAAPAIDVPVVTQAPEEYATISKKFAKQKGWMSTEYGEYRDVEGNTVGVVGLSGEVVPVRTNDREEYKIFAEKNKV